MVPSDKHPILIFFLVFLTTKLSIIASFANGEDYSKELCHDREKEALLSFKQDLVDPSNKLSSWVAKYDCCKWAGIVCNNLTGHVTELRLSNAGNRDDRTPLKGKLNPSLLSLKHLSYLDLSNNDFGGIQVPSFIGSLVGLTYLNLSQAGFDGVVPHRLGNLSNLRQLDLRNLDGSMRAENLDWISGLHSLEHLDMSGVSLVFVFDSLMIFNKLPSLSELRLSSCGLLGIFQPPFPVNFSSLSILDLSFNSFSCSLLNWVFNLTGLVHLDLSYNDFDCPFPNISWSSTSLRSLDVSGNHLNSTIPNSLYGSNLENLNLGSNDFHGVLSSAIGNMTSIVSLDLSDNALEGKIPSAVGNLCSLEAMFLTGNKYNGRVSEVFEILSSGCVSDHLKSLDLAENSFSGQMMDQILEFKNILYLSLSYNNISGPIPTSLEKLSRLRTLDVSGNKLNGPLPESLGSLSNLEQLVISDNLFEGIVSEVHFANLTNLKRLAASGNSLSLKVNQDWIPPFHLKWLEMVSWKLGPQFPMWLHSQIDVERIDLSNTGLSDAIPSWFWNLSLRFSKMNLSHNQISGEIPRTLNVSCKSRIYLGFNQLKGPLPRISSTITVLDLSNNNFSGDLSGLLCHPINGVRSSLMVLLLRENLLSGKIPNCWMYWKSLAWIHLANNNLTGEIPSSMGSLKDLMSLHLRNNKLSGKLPQTLQNCSLLIILDLGLNEFVGRIPKWFGGNLSRLRILILDSNKFRGHIPVEICRLYRLQILIVADNNLSGSIPNCFNDFNAMATKQETYASIEYGVDDVLMESLSIVIKTREGQYGSILNLVTCLDLSSNNFSSEIPEELTSLQGLVAMNLSGNNLKGNIPYNIGNMTWVESLDLSRNQLSGKIPLSISNLHFLTELNVSNNNLSGEIPRSTQLQSMDGSGFFGNQLCGPPLTKDCNASQKKTPGTENRGQLQDEDEGEEVEYWFRLGIAVGFAVGFLGIIFPLVFFRVWRHAYFWFVQYMWHKISDCIFNFRYMIINNFIRTGSI